MRNGPNAAQTRSQKVGAPPRGFFASVEMFRSISSQICSNRARGNCEARYLQAATRTGHA